MQERQSIYLKRKSGEKPPWTKDQILANYKFCNCYREQDRVTLWIKENWREPYAKDKNLMFAMVVARIINWPSTLEAIGYPTKWEPERVEATLRQRKSESLKTYTSAYLLGQVRNAKDRAEYTVKLLDNVYRGLDLYDQLWNKNTTLEMTHKFLTTFDGIGLFLAYEVVTDLRWTGYLIDAPDIMTWANVGPGAIRGLNRVYNRPLKQHKPQAKLLEELLVVQDWVIANRDSTILPTIEPRDIEHCLCEVDKNERAKERIKNGESIGLERFPAGRAKLVPL